MTLSFQGHDFAYEMECITRIFFPGVKINTVNDDDFTDDFAITTRIECQNGDKFRLTVKVNRDDFDKTSRDEIPSGNDGLCERRLGILLFRLLAEMTGESPVWGILTGIRPVRLCGMWRGQGLDDDGIFTRMTQDYLVSPEKARLCVETLNAQQKILALNTPGTFSLYIGIPFCPTRCLYCSFVSHAIDKAEKLVPDYVRLLCDEVKAIAGIAKDKGLKLLTVYVGGGTPTSLSAVNLGDILAAVNDNFDLSDLLEYTVEAGRADTVTAEKLEVLKAYGVGRISINPQTMNDAVLNAIGRSHTSARVVESFNLARRVGFKSINMDLIVGLPTDTAESFSESLDKVISLSPENITVHTLSVKRSSTLRGSDDAFSSSGRDAAVMTEYSAKALTGTGYFPYYLYRQKPAVDNLENIGYSKPGFEGYYNIYSMEDTHNIYAAGAGGVSKLVTNSGVARIFNYKYPYEYINRFDEILNRKGVRACEI